MGDTLTNVLCSILIGLTYKYVYAVMSFVVEHLRRLI